MWYIIKKLFTSVLLKVVDIYLYFGEQLLTNVIKNVFALLIDQDLALFFILIHLNHKLQISFMLPLRSTLEVNCSLIHHYFPKSSSISYKKLS